MNIIQVLVAKQIYTKNSFCNYDTLHYGILSANDIKQEFNTMIKNKFIEVPSNATNKHYTGKVENVEVISTCYLTPTGFQYFKNNLLN